MMSENKMKSGVLPAWCRYVNTFGGEVVIPYRTKKAALEEDEIMIDEALVASGAVAGGPKVVVHRFHKRTATYTRNRFIELAKVRAGWLGYAQSSDDRRTISSFLTQFFRFWWLNKEKGDAC